MSNYPGQYNNQYVPQQGQGLNQPGYMQPGLSQPGFSQHQPIGKECYGRECNMNQQNMQRKRSSSSSSSSSNESPRRKAERERRRELKKQQRVQQGGFINNLRNKIDDTIHKKWAWSVNWLTLINLAFFYLILRLLPIRVIISIINIKFCIC